MTIRKQSVYLFWWEDETHRGSNWDAVENSVLERITGLKENVEILQYMLSLVYIAYFYSPGTYQEGCLSLPVSLLLWTCEISRWKCLYYWYVFLFIVTDFSYFPNIQKWHCSVASHATKISEPSLIDSLLTSEFQSSSLVPNRCPNPYLHDIIQSWWLSKFNYRLVMISQ